MPPVVSAIEGKDGVVAGAGSSGAFGDLGDAEGLVDLLDVNGEACRHHRGAGAHGSQHRERPHADADEVEIRPGQNEHGRPRVGGGPRRTGQRDTGAVQTIRDDGRLRDELSTVDNAETILGWVATVLEARAARAGTVGHFGVTAPAARSQTWILSADRARSWTSSRGG
ncbi:MAG: copper transporter [Ilumatobacteraceae bacterium]